MPPWQWLAGRKAFQLLVCFFFLLERQVLPCLCAHGHSGGASRSLQEDPRIGSGPESVHCARALLVAARSNGNFSAFFQRADETGFEQQLVDSFKPGSALTLLIPVNAAFEGLKPTVKTRMEGSPQILKDTLNYHAVAGWWPSSAINSTEVLLKSNLRDMFLPMVEDKGQLHVGFNNRPEAFIVAQDVIIILDLCALHAISAVLLPPKYFLSEVFIPKDYLPLLGPYLDQGGDGTNVALIVLLVLLPLLAFVAVLACIIFLYLRRKQKLLKGKIQEEDSPEDPKKASHPPVLSTIHSAGSGVDTVGDSFSKSHDKVPTSWGVAAGSAPGEVGSAGGVLSWGGPGVVLGGSTGGLKGDFEDVEVAPGDMWKSFASGMQSWGVNSAETKDSSSGTSATGTGSGPSPVIDARMLLSQIKLRPEDYVGGGSFGRVYRWQHLGTEYAVKVLVGRKDTLEELWREVLLLRELRHPNVLQFMFALSNPPSEVYIVTEYMPRGSLFRLLHESDEEVTVRQRILMALDVAKGMAFLHALNIVHRDLKSANLLVHNDGSIKVCDFGQARNVLGTRLETCNRAGTAPYTSPEAYQDFQRTPKQADLYSFGIILWELMARQQPWAGLNEYHLMKAVVIEDKRPELGADWHPGVVDLIQRCWVRDPLQRPSFEDCVAMLQPIVAELH